MFKWLFNLVHDNNDFVDIISAKEARKLAEVDVEEYDYRYEVDCIMKEINKAANKKQRSVIVNRPSVKTQEFLMVNLGYMIFRLQDDSKHVSINWD